MVTSGIHYLSGSPFHPVTLSPCHNLMVYNNTAPSGSSLMVKLLPSKQVMRVRFSSPAPIRASVAQWIEQPPSKW